MKKYDIRSYFIEYESFSIYKYWNFTRKYFLTSHNLTFLETEFPYQSDFNDLPISAFLIHNPTSISELNESSKSKQAHEQVIHEQIIIQPPFIDHTFAVYDSLVDNISLSFKDVMSRVDYKF